MNNLPLEIRAKILSHLSPDDLLTARKVCTTWKDLIETHIWTNPLILEWRQDYFGEELDELHCELMDFMTKAKNMNKSNPSNIVIPQRIRDIVECRELPINWRSHDDDLTPLLKAVLSEFNGFCFFGLNCLSTLATLAKTKLGYRFRDI